MSGERVHGQSMDSLFRRRLSSSKVFRIARRFGIDTDPPCRVLQLKWNRYNSCYPAASATLAAGWQGDGFVNAGWKGNVPCL